MCFIGFMISVEASFICISIYLSPPNNAINKKVIFTMQHLNLQLLQLWALDVFSGILHLQYHVVCHIHLFIVVALYIG